MRFRRFYGAPAIGLFGVSAVVAVALSAYPAQASRSSARPAASRVVGRLFTETNAKRNQIIVLDRHADGSLTRKQAIATGGAGAFGRHGCAAVEGCSPFVDSQGQVVLVPGKKLLFAVNTGSDTVSSFRVTPGGLKLADQKPSGGAFPNSLAASGNLLYVVNTGGLNVSGFRFSPTGKLTVIRGSKRRLDRSATAGSPRQIGFDNTGKLLAVTLLKSAEVETFSVNANGALSPPRAFGTSDTLPFGFGFDPSNRMVLTQIHDLTGPHGTVASYSITRSSGAGVQIDRKPAQGFGPCWITLSRDGRFVYVVNTGSGDPTGATIVVYSLSSAGDLSQIQLTSPINISPGQPEFFRTNVLLSSDGRYLYVVVPGHAGKKGRIDFYRVAGDGTLSLAGKTATTLPPGISGLAGG